MAHTESDHEEGLAWQVGIWDQISPLYVREIDCRFIPVIDQVMLRARSLAGLRVLDVGTGTGAVAMRAGPLARGGDVIGVDISRQMLDIAERLAFARQLDNTAFVEGRAEDLPFEDNSVDLILASLSLMYVLNRPAAASEFARVLRQGGRVVAAYWAGPERNDIVAFQMMAGSFAPKPPLPGVGPGSMASGNDFVDALRSAGFEATLETESVGFVFDTFEDAWDVLAGVTSAGMTPEKVKEAKASVRQAFWPNDGGPRYFSNLTQFVTGTKV